MTRFGTAWPILQAPMAGVQDEALAIAVSRGGGLGALPGAMVDAATLEAQGAALAAATGRRFNLNFFCHAPPAAEPARESGWRRALAPYFREAGLDADAVPAAPARRPFDADLAALVERIRPAFVSFHFGLPGAALLARVRATGAQVLASATTLDEAQWLEANGADAIIAQGLEAGGHRGCFRTDDLSTQIGTLALVPQLVRAVRLPIIAAGGIADAAGVRAALALGAEAVQVGTAFLCCTEARTSAVHRAALQGELPGVRPDHSALTNLFTGRPARGLVNRLMRDLGPLSELAPSFPLAGAALAPLRAWAEARGRGDFTPLWAGQNTAGCGPGDAADKVRELAGA